MKRFFQRLDNSSNHQRSEYQRETLGGNGGPSSHSSGGSFIGKVFTLGQYHCTVEDIIAEGGFALVFLVKAQSSLGRFALKRLHVNNEQDLANCKREIEIAKQLGSHKNIVQLVESSINYTPNGVYEILMLMQYCKGHLLQLLNDRIKDGLPESEVVRILCDLCEAIARMHHNDPPILHRDLKVENVLISETGTYLLCDFGSATTKVLGLDSSNASGQSALAIEEEIKRYTTLAYRSPEMVDVYSGKPITTKADIWALGCLLYKICFFTLPFGESTLAIQNATFTIPDDKADLYSSKLLSLIGYMLTPDPDERPDIYQVSALAFKLANQKSPVPNLTVTKQVLVPAWADLRVPPTESQARETRETRKISTVSQQNVVSGLQPDGGGAATFMESIALDNRTTSVTPRQRPKASININSVLPTSPLPFARATTPSDLATTSSVSGNNLSVNTPAGATGHHLTTSTSFNSNLGGAVVVAGSVVDDDDDDIDWSKKKNRPTSGHQQPNQSSSNPQLNNPASYVDYPAASSKNPFLDSTGLPQPLPGPPSRRHSQTPPGLAHPANRDHATSASTTNAPNAHYAHRRNMSDTSAFSSKNVTSNSVVTTTVVANSSPGAAGINPPPPPQAAARVRSLNPFEDPNDISYEDQLFGHEFDKIRQENQPSVPVPVPRKPKNDKPKDPFEAAPFNPAQLKRYIEKQQSAEDQSQVQQPLPNSGKPYLINVTSSDQSVQPQAHSKSTVITIRSNNDFVIHNQVDAQAPVPSAAISSVSASTSSAFISLGPTNSTAALLDANMPIAADQSISSSSQGQVPFEQAANYMPLYSSDTAEDSSEDSDDSDNDSVRAGDDGRELVTGDYEDEVIDSAHVAQEMSSDLMAAEAEAMKPLVAEEESESEYEDEDAADDSSDSSIGSASDLQQTDDSDSDSESSSDGGDHIDADNQSSSSEEPNDTLNDPVHGPSHRDDGSGGHDSDGFEFVNYDGTMSNKNVSWYNYRGELVATSTPSAGVATKNISRIQITNCSTEVEDPKDQVSLSTGDGTSVGEVMSTTSSINSSTTRNTANDNTSASIDHLIGHIEGHRPLLEEEDDQDDSEDPSQVKPFIEIDKEIEYVPPVVTASAADQLTDSIMFNSMSSSISSVILNQPKDLLTSEDPSPPTGSTYSDFETLSMQQIVDESEENRRLDEEVAQSLNSQVIYDQIHNKDLFGSIPFTDKELITKQIQAQKSAKPAIAPKPTVTQTSQPITPPPLPPPANDHQKFESSFTEIAPPPALDSQKKPTSFVAVPPPTVQAPIATKSTDLFGAVPFQSTTVASSQTTAISQPANVAATNSAVAVSSQPQQQPIKIAPPLQIITLKPVNHQSQQPVTVSKPPVVATNTKPIQASVSVVSSSSAIASSAQVSKPIQPIAPKPIPVQPSLATSQPVVPMQPIVPTGPKNSALQKSNSKLKSKVAKKYEVDESDDEVDGLLDPNEDESENIMDLSGKGSKDSKKKDKKKDKKDKSEKKSKEKEKSKEEKKKEKEKSKEKPEKEKKEKVKEPKKSKEDKEKEKSEKKAEKVKEKEKKFKLKESKSKEDSKDLKSLVPAASSTPTKASNSKESSKESKESKDLKSSKSTSSKLKVPKHQAFANMSFEDETNHGGASAAHTNHHLVTNTSNSSSSNNAVTITRC